MTTHQTPMAAGCAADAPTGPVPVIVSPRHDASVRIETIVIPTQDQPWQTQRVTSMALRRRSDHLVVGEGICPVMDTRPIAGGVAVDLLVPSGTQPIDEHDGLPLTIEQVHRLVLPIVDSLCSLHDAGMAHGGISRSAIRRRSDGRGVLFGFDPDARPDQDVADMAGLILDLVPSGSIDGQEAALLTRAVDHDPHRQPTMADLAQALTRSNRGWGSSSMPSTGSPPARRRAPVEPANDPVARLRQHTPHHHARRASRSRSLTSRRSLPWSIMSAMAGASAVTWMIAAMVM